MLTEVKPTDRPFAARLLEVLDPHAHWTRAVWNSGICLTARELLEAIVAMRSGNLSDAAVARLVQACKRSVGKDPAVSTEEKQLFQALLQQIPRADGMNFVALSQVVSRIEPQYLRRWSEVVASNDVSPEHGARCVAMHLLDSGFSEVYLHQWFSDHIHSSSESWTLSELLARAHDELGNLHKSDFEILVLFKNAPRSRSGYPQNWLKSAEVAAWLRGNGSETAGVRVAGGFVLSVDALDASAAVESAISLVDGYVARASVATSQQLVPWAKLWVKGCPVPFPYQSRDRGLMVKALYREDQIFGSGYGNSNVDAAIELLAHLKNSSASAAVAAGWAAIEILLAEPDNRSIAADRLASLVACSLPRAELTRLSYQLERSDPALGPELRLCSSNRDRAELVLTSIRDGEPLTLVRVTDTASAKQLLAFLNDPSKFLSAWQTAIADAFHRLYRQRNLILHGGRTDSVGLLPSLRTASRLVGAGIDRIAHAAYVEQTQPLELAARARLAISLVKPFDIAGCLGLLEQGPNRR